MLMWHDVTASIFTFTAIGLAGGGESLWLRWRTLTYTTQFWFPLWITAGIREGMWPSYFLYLYIYFRGQQPGYWAVKPFRLAQSTSFVGLTEILVVALANHKKSCWFYLIEVLNICEVCCKGGVTGPTAPQHRQHGGQNCPVLQKKSYVRVWHIQVLELGITHRDKAHSFYMTDCFTCNEDRCGSLRDSNVICWFCDCWLLQLLSSVSYERCTTCWSFSLPLQSRASCLSTSRKRGWRKIKLLAARNLSHCSAVSLACLVEAWFSTATCWTHRGPLCVLSSVYIWDILPFWDILHGNHAFCLLYSVYFTHDM